LTARTRTLRFTDDEMMQNMENVLQAIITSLRPSPLPALSPEGERNKKEPYP
jgi:hypothetical protein